MKFGRRKEKPGNPGYDDDRFYDTTSVVSQTDCTGLQPRPPVSEGEAEAYGELFNIPQPTEQVNNGLQNVKKTKNNEDVKPENFQ